AAAAAAAGAPAGAAAAARAGRRGITAVAGMDAAPGPTMLRHDASRAARGGVCEGDADRNAYHQGQPTPRGGSRDHAPLHTRDWRGAPSCATCAGPESPAPVAQHEPEGFAQLAQAGAGESGSPPLPANGTRRARTVARSR